MRRCFGHTASTGKPSTRTFVAGRGTPASRQRSRNRASVGAEVGLVVLAQRPVLDGVDAEVDSVKARPLEAAANCAPADAEVTKLPNRNDAVLASGQLGHGSLSRAGE